MPEKNYIVVSLEDVMKVLSKTTDFDTIEELKRLYSSENYNEFGNRKIYKGSKLYSILKKDCPINMEMLSFALTRASYERNISIRNKLLKYIHRFLDNIKNEVDNEMLICQISEDKDVMNYIFKFDTWADYSDQLVTKKTEKKTLVINQTEEEKRKSFVMM